MESLGTERSRAELSRKEIWDLIFNRPTMYPTGERHATCSASIALMAKNTKNVYQPFVKFLNLSCKKGEA